MLCAAGLGAIYAGSYAYVRTTCPMNLVKPPAERVGDEDMDVSTAAAGYCSVGDIGYIALEIVPLPFYCLGGIAVFLAGSDYMKRVRRRAERKRRIHSARSEEEAAGIKKPARAGRRRQV